MRIEHITSIGLLKAYIAANYPTGIVCAINRDEVDSYEEDQTLVNELRAFGVIPDCMLIPGWFLFETTKEVAADLTAHHHKSSIVIYTFEDGQLVNENR